MLSHLTVLGALKQLVALSSCREAWMIIVQEIGMQLSQKVMVLVQQRPPGTTCSAALGTTHLTCHILPIMMLQPQHTMLPQDTLVLVMCMKLATPERTV